MGSFKFSDLLDNAEDGPKPIAADTYEVVVDRSTAKTTAKGKTMFATMFKVVGGPNDGHPIWWNATVSPESPTALGIFFRQMSALGLGNDFFAADPSDEQVAAALVGKAAKIKVELGEWNGQAKNEVKNVSPSSNAVSASIPAPAAAAPASADAPAPAASGAEPPKAPF